MKQFKLACCFFVCVLFTAITVKAQNINPPEPCPYKQNASGTTGYGQQRSGNNGPWNPVASPAPSQTYYIRMYNIDDEATAYVNGQPVSKVSYDGDSEWVNIQRYLKNGSNTVRFVLQNNQESWSYGFGLSRDQEFIWKDECGRVGYTGCKNNNQTVGVVFDKTIDFLYGEGQPARTTPPSRNGGNAMYTASHAGWIGFRPRKNQYAFDVTHYTPGSQWFLSANAFISNCGDTSGPVYMRRDGGPNIKVGTWNQQVLPCHPAGDMPGNPDNIGLTEDLHNYAMSKQTGVITLDVSRVITGNGRYITEWRFDTGCCAAFATEMKLRGEW